MKVVLTGEFDSSKKKFNCKVREVKLIKRVKKIMFSRKK